MASHQVGSLPAKMSFAKIAAMPPPSQAMKSKPTPQSEASPRHEEDRSTRRVSQANPIASTKPQASSMQSQKSPNTVGEQGERLAGRIEGLALVKNASLEKEAAAKPEHSPIVAGADSTEDDQSHLSNNSSREPPSFDTKSIASVTTFAMDEKESLRPDDSASVQAADDDDSSSAPSCNPSIHGEAEQGASARVLPYPNGNAVGVVRPYPSIRLANPPQFGAVPMSPITEAAEMRQARGLAQEVTSVEGLKIRGGGMEGRPQMLAVMPDEKLLDALASPKDRLPLLQLEEQLISFIVHADKGGPQVLDLPPQNSFGRLLAHKLADYYSLQHVISDDSTSVRLYKMRAMTYNLPTSLATLASSISVGPTPVSGSAAFKIMRRNGLGARAHSAGGSTAASSSAPSKATSENGADASDEGLMSPSDGTPPKDRSTLTREEREANYKVARERIFADFQEALPSEAASTTGDTSASISRSSSSSGRRKSGKQRRPKDDSFEARSQFIQGGFPPMSIGGQQNAYHGPYNDPGFAVPYPGNTTNTAATFGGTPTQAYTGFETNMQYPSMSTYSSHMQPTYSPNDQWLNPSSPQPGNYYGYAASQHQPSYPQSHTPVAGITPYSQQVNMPTSVPPNWGSNQYQSSFQQTPTLNNPQPVQWPSYSPSSTTAGHPPYPYGQLPSQPYASPAYNAQHPVPGSYNGNRSLFNPNSRSFVPSNATSRSGGRNNRKKNSTSSSGGQSKQAKQNSAHSENAIPIPQRPLQSASSSSSSPGAKDLPLQQKYGAPAHLPKKPPPSQVPVQFETDIQALKSESAVSGPLVVNGGAGREGA